MGLIAILAYNEAKTVVDVAERAAAYGETMVMDDGSTDATPQIMADSSLRFLRHTLNQGGGAGFKTIATYAHTQGYDHLITIDGDGEHNPDELPHILAALGKPDIVIGSRFLQGWPQMPPYQSAGCLFFTWLTAKLGGARLTDATSCFRAYKLETLNKILPSLRENQYYALEVLLKLLKNGATVKEVPISYTRRRHGSSHKGTLRYAWNLLRVAWEAA